VRSFYSHGNAIGKKVVCIYIEVVVLECRVVNALIIHVFPRILVIQLHHCSLGIKRQFQVPAEPGTMTSIPSILDNLYHLRLVNSLSYMGAGN